MPRGVFKHKSVFKHQKTIGFDDHDYKAVSNMVAKVQEKMPDFTFSDFIRWATGYFTGNPRISNFIQNELRMLRAEAEAEKKPKELKG